MNTFMQWEVLKQASLFLKKSNREEKVAEILLRHHLGMNRTEFVLGLREKVPEDVRLKFERDIKKHAETGIPVQHLVGVWEFYGRNFKVNKHVLVPRPETEEVLQAGIEAIEADSRKDAPTIVDVGTGSSVIATTLALELPESRVLATDISEDALGVARENVDLLGAKVEFLQGDFLEPLINGGLDVDMVISNPPYIARDAELSDTVKNFDPELALFADNKGLAAYERIASQLREVLNPGGLVVFEIGYDQGVAVSGILAEQFPGASVRVLQDINGQDRIVVARDLV